MNTRRTTHTLTALTAAALAAALAGCNTSANADPHETIGRCTECTAAPTPTATSTTIDAAGKEQADRSEAEAVWRKFNALVGSVELLPADRVDAAVNAVSINPTAASLRKENLQFRAQHQAGYGQVLSFITWEKPINGADTAVLSDCQDGSQSGVLDTKTGAKLVVGAANTPFKGTLTRTSSGWRVATAELLGGTCAG